MLPLPATPFESAVWSVAKVPNDYLVSDGRNKYSVPYNLIGEKVDVRVTKNLVEVYYPRQSGGQSPAFTDATA